MYPNVTSLFEYNNIIIKTIFDCLPCIARNDWFFQKYHDVLNELGQLPLSDMYSNPFYYYLLTKIIIPSERIQKQVNNYSDMYFKNTNVIGLQLRTGIFPHRTEHVVGFLAVNHTHMIQEAKRLYYDVVSMNYSAIVYISSISLLFYRFIVTDNIDMKYNLSNSYPFMITYNSTLDHSDKISLKGYSQAATDSLIEMYLLSKCDMIVKTPHSSFGNTSQFIGGHF